MSSSNISLTITNNQMYHLIQVIHPKYTCSTETAHESADDFSIEQIQEWIEYHKWLTKDEIQKAHISAVEVANDFIKDGESADVLYMLKVALLESILNKVDQGKLITLG